MIYIPITEKWTIIILGRWNPNIFSPEWLTRHVLEEQNVSLEFAVQPGIPHRVTGDGVTIMPSSSRIVLTLNEITDDSLLRMENIAIKILETLCHTPITQTGVNFGYKVELPQEQVFEHFPLTDDAQFADLDLRLRTRSHRRSLEIEDRILNLTVDINSDGLDFEFNFHSETPEPPSAIEKLLGKLPHLRNISETILETIYGVRRVEE